MKCLSHQSLILFSVGLLITTQIKASSSLEQDPNLYRHYGGDSNWFINGKIHVL
ncbi:hypothetical protein PDPUS_1_01357 [Photobacterium damselae subsp. piscicida]|uniref:Uncharacterized protein n=1 Tax=Photobacterium damsela subsp. piscicida TaxID=38294 RepID=A0AAD1FNR0_PHODP|nr:hypothetical protein PDPUS_1_01357 [Photobacterium damselae subsp. piscicida]GAW45244.1 hypothetical protein PDPJ_1_02659 [Photobacterium damselae subsp. piscicida]